ncbi:hypothetical protein [Undibacter mobilis]|uniref:Uncharacterized protein n=1 Tax=Undibacter mobilis TaxID=2292256 RepID=A0A371B7S4_9BRAD|nr:hypothetical protein [Undibacter mobilis]RDV03547.1 hypothetical protein DXH78_02460 [Undibacter mobilis]
MSSRLAITLIAVVGSVCVAQAADLGDTWSGDCNCGSDMIVVYDSEPGVVTRQWKSDCDCRYVPDPRRPYRMAMPAGPRFESLRDPWRR